MNRILTVTLAAALTLPALAQYKKNPQGSVPSGKIQVPRTAPGSPVQITSAAPMGGPSIENARRINRDAAYKLAQQGKAVFIDVRTKESYDKGHIKGALSIPLSQFAQRINEFPQDKLLITYCACSAEQTSGRAVLDLNARGITEAAALTGGWDQWVAAKLPTAITK